jgi:hypothetical protein
MIGEGGIMRIAMLAPIITGIIQDRDYFSRKVSPHLDGELVCCSGPLGPSHRNKLRGCAYALLHLSLQGFNMKFVKHSTNDFPNSNENARGGSTGRGNYCRGNER